MIRDYDINDYKTKAELTRTRLYTTLTAAIRLNQLCTIDTSQMWPGPDRPRQQ